MIIILQQSHKWEFLNFPPFLAFVNNSQLITVHMHSTCGNSKLPVFTFLPYLRSVCMNVFLDSWYSMIWTLLIASRLFIMIKGNQSESEFLFDFTTMDNVDDWYEVSDTVREVGKSKAALVLQKTRQFRRAVFFALLNPQPNGACFAGMYKDGPFDFSAYSGLEVKFKSQSRDISRWKILLKTPVSTDRFTSYEQKFEVLISFPHLSPPYLMLMSRHLKITLGLKLHFCHLKTFIKMSMAQSIRMSLQ